MPRLYPRSLRLFLAGPEERPRSGFHVSQHWFLPIIFRVIAQEVGLDEVAAARVASARPEAHIARHARIHGFALHSASRMIRPPVPFLDAALRCFHVTTE